MPCHPRAQNVNASRQVVIEERKVRAANGSWRLSGPGNPQIILRRHSCVPGADWCLSIAVYVLGLRWIIPAMTGGQSRDRPSVSWRIARRSGLSGAAASKSFAERTLSRPGQRRRMVVLAFGENRGHSSFWVAQRFSGCFLPFPSPATRADGGLQAPPCHCPG